MTEGLAIHQILGNLTRVLRRKEVGGKFWPPCLPH